jgi:predicted dehydrogenase
VISEIGNYIEFYDLMYEAIRNHKNLPVSGEEALNVIKIIETAIKSNEEKRIITL